MQPVTRLILWNNSMSKGLRFFSTEARRWTENMVRRNREFISEWHSAEQYTLRREREQELAWQQVCELA